MSIYIKNIVSALEEWAPPMYQESYDNAGLIVGSMDCKVTGILICLDCIETVVEEAIKRKANLIVAHHPILFSGLKRLNGSNYVERTLLKAIKNDIAIYAIHTNLDNVADGVNHMICSKLNLQDTRILHTREDSLFKLVTFSPEESAEQVQQALFDAGAGQIGNYSEAGFSVSGIGTFKGNEFSNPSVGKKGTRESVSEIRIEVLFPAHLKSSIVRALKTAHPYEEVAYDLYSLGNSNQHIGSGMIGVLEKKMEVFEFLSVLKETFHVQAIRHSKICKKHIQRVAVCGGSGSFLIPHAIQANADIFVTADMKYHQFFDAEHQVIIADIGHFESEQFTSLLIKEKLLKKFPNFAVFLAETRTNPVYYFL